MADATASTSAGSSSTTKEVSGDLANCQVVLTDFTKASSSLNDLVAQQSVEQPLNGNSNWYIHTNKHKQPIRNQKKQK